jgi:serine/threonine protein kinase
MPIESLADNLYSTKSDSFALGVLIYYLASRRFPWRGKDKTELISNYRRRAHRSSAVAHLPPRVKHMVSGLLEMQPEKRLHLCECDLEVFLHMGLPLQLEEQLEALRGRYSEQLKLCQFIDSLFHNYDAYSWANDYLQEFMARHLGSITVRF